MVLWKHYITMILNNRKIFQSKVTRRFKHNNNQGVVRIDPRYIGKDATVIIHLKNDDSVDCD